MLIYCIVLGYNSDEKKPDVSSASSDVEDSGMERLRKYLTQKLRLTDSSSDQSDEKQQKVLRELSLDGIVEYIKQNKNCKIITMAGAGISTCEFVYEFIFKDIIHSLKIIHIIYIVTLS